MRILIIHQGALGDFILSLPAIRSFRQTYPDSSIEIWGYPGILKLVEGRFYADTIASINQEGMPQLYSEHGTVPERLIEQFKRFDLIVLFGGEQHNTFVGNLHLHGVRAIYRISTFPKAGGNTHVIDHQLSQLSRLGLHTACSVPMLFPSGEDSRRAAEFFKDNKIVPGAFTVAMHMGSGSRKKAWPPGNFAQLTDKLVNRRGARVLVLSGPADAEGERDYRHLLSSDNTIALNNFPLSELPAILKRCAVFVGNDSGITHLAAAAGAPAVALFGPTDPKVWGPRGEHIAILGSPAECAPCSREKMQGCISQKCMEELSVEEVYDAIAKRG